MYISEGKTIKSEKSGVNARKTKCSHKVREKNCDRLQGRYYNIYPAVIHVGVTCYGVGGKIYPLYI